MTPRALVGAATPSADTVLMHGVSGGRMVPLSRIDVPARGRVLLAPGSYHLMLRGLRHPLALGDTVSLELWLAPGGVLTVRVPVLRYTDAVNELPGS
jgi:copper(I)-binding protein